VPARLILVARVGGAFGVRGEIKLTTYTDDPMAAIGYRDLLREDGAPALTLTGGRPAKGGLVVRAREVESREQAEALRGLQLFVPRARLPEPDADEFYLTDLIGLEARTPEGAALGAVKSVQNFGAGDLLEIAPADGSATWWLPFTLDAVPEVRIADGWLTAVRPEEVEGEEP
jgi:16S rRNA processing protein RimM